jgi:hypothetical protein
VLAFRPALKSFIYDLSRLYPATQNRRKRVLQQTV